MPAIFGFRSFCLGLALASTLYATGCSRTRYRMQADREAYSIVREKSCDPRWPVDNFNINIDPRSRYYSPYNPDCEPMPPDDPASHRYMECVAGKSGWKHWLANGSIDEIQNPGWRDLIPEYMPMTETGKIKLDLPSSVSLAYMHSPTWRQQLETLYLSALDVSAERFRYVTQFFGNTGPNFLHSGQRRSGVERNTLSEDSGLTMRRRFATGADLLVNFANSFVWQFAGPNTNTSTSLLGFSFTQPLLRLGGRARELELLTIAERVLLGNIRSIVQFRQGYYATLAVGEQAVQGPVRRGGFLGGSGITGFTGQGAGGFGTVGGAGNFGFFGGFGAGAAGGAGGAGVAGGGAGQVGGFLGLLQTQQQVRNAADNVALELRTLGLLEANLEANRIDITQVDIFRQTVQTDRATLLQQQIGLQNQIETFIRTQLGLPPDLPVELDDGPIQQFQLIDRRVVESQSKFLDFVDALGALEGDPTEDQLLQAIDALAQLRLESGDQFANVQADLDVLESRSESRERILGPEDVAEFRAAKESLNASLAEIQRRFDATADAIENLKTFVNPDTRGEAANGLVAEAKSLSDLMQELSLIQARARLESVTLDPIDVSMEEALQLARTYRLDWMNARAQLVDSWRLIAFNANALYSDVTVTLGGDIQNVGDNPLNFAGTAGTLRAGLRFDAPFTRLLERNNYRNALISYQQSRRQLIQFEDQINQTMRQNIRQLDYLKLNLQIQRDAVAIAVRRVDQTREDLQEPPAPTQPGAAPAALGPTSAQNLVNALQALRESQNNFMSVWLNYYSTRMTLMRDMGLMEIDDNGLWIDRPLDEILADRMAGCEGGAYEAMPPAATDQMLRDADIDPNEIDYNAPPADAMPTPAEPGQGAAPESDKSTYSSPYGAPGGIEEPEPESLGRRMWNSLFRKKTPEPRPVPQVARTPQSSSRTQSAFR